jgi:hypothetical protein
MHIPLRISGFYTRAKFIQPLKERNVPELGYELLLAGLHGRRHQTSATQEV